MVREILYALTAFVAVCGAVLIAKEVVSPKPMVVHLHHNTTTDIEPKT